MIYKWETLESRKKENLKIFDVWIYNRKNPKWNKSSDFVVLDSPRWVNIIPITTEKNVVLVEQYRHGVDEITLEVPGGLVEHNEEPQAAAERECIEETGFSSNQKAILLGENQPNPAFLNNSCFSYVWFDCQKNSLQKLDGNEDIRVVEIPMDKIKDYILNGTIKHSLVLTAFFFYNLRYGL